MYQLLVWSYTTGPFTKYLVCGGGEGALSRQWPERFAAGVLLWLSFLVNFCSWRLCYFEFHSWLIFVPFYLSGNSRIPPKNSGNACRHHIFLRSKHTCHLNAVSSTDIAPPDMSPKTGRSTPWAAPCLSYPVDIFIHYLPKAWEGDLHVFLWML